YELDVIAEAEPDEGAPPLKVQSTASVEEEEGSPWTYAWDFGDGAKSTEQNPTHTYEKVGEYTATLTVTDQKGNKGNDEIDIFVETDDGEGGGEGGPRGRSWTRGLDLLLRPLELAERGRERRHGRAAPVAVPLQAARQVRGTRVGGGGRLAPAVPGLDARVDALERPGRLFLLLGGSGRR